MKKNFLLFGVLFFMSTLTFFSCLENEEHEADISKVQVDLEIYDLQQQLFEIDTTHFLPALENVRNMDTASFDDFFAKVLGIPKNNRVKYFQEIQTYFRSYKPVYDSLKLMSLDFEKIQEELLSAYKHFQYYFPKYRLPKVVFCITTFDAFINAPFGTTSEILTDNAVFVSLLFHAGTTFPYYRTGQFMNQYPDYIRNYFIPENIATSVVKLFLDDLFPERINDGNLLHQMIVKGKKLFLLSKILPETPPYIFMNYSEEQYALCNEARGFLWRHFKEGDLLFTKDPNIIRQYIGESPFTTRLPKDFPGNVGAFVGFQIVNAYTSKYPLQHIADIMPMSAEEILDKSKYKPK